MNITKQKLQKIIKEEVKTAIEEGFFSKMFSKFGVQSEKTRRALIGYSVWLEGTEKLAKRIEQDRAKDEHDIKKYLKNKQELAEKREAAAESIMAHGANKAQLSEYNTLERSYESLKKYKMSWADEAIAGEEKYQADLAAAKEQEEKAKKAADEANQAFLKWRREQKHKDQRPKEVPSSGGGSAYDKYDPGRWQDTGKAVNVGNLEEAIDSKLTKESLTRLIRQVAKEIKK